MKSWARLGGFAGVVSSFVALATLGRFEGLRGPLPFLWHGAGIALAATFIGGRAFLGAVALGACFGSVILGLPVGIAALLGVVSALQTEVGVMAVRRLGARPSLPRLRDVLVLLGGGGLAFGLCGGVLGSLVLVLAGKVTSSQYLRTVEIWALRDIVGVATMSPLVLFAARRRNVRRVLDDREALVSCLLAAATVGSLLVLVPHPGAWLVLPILMWMAIRVGPLGVALSLAVVGLVASIAPDASGRIGESALPHELVDFATICLAAASVSLAASVSEARRSERRRLRIEAEELAIRQRGALREHLLAIVGHDLRGPLATVAAASRLLAQTSDPASQKLAAVTERAATRMSLLVEDLLDFARTRLSGISLVVGEHDLGELCERLVEEARISHPHRTIDLITSGDLTGAWDGHRIEQMLGNIIGNALTHGEEWLRIEMTEGASNDLVIRIANGGKPIPQHALAQIFEPYRQGREPRSGSKSGLGLGLYIVREIAQAHGGSVDATSTVEEGTVFRVVLPRDARVFQDCVVPHAVEMGTFDPDDSVRDLSAASPSSVSDFPAAGYPSVSKVRALEPARLAGPSRG